MEYKEKMWKILSNMQNLETTCEERFLKIKTENNLLKFY